MSRGRQTLSGLYQPQVPTRAEWYQNGWPNRDDQTITFTNVSETFEIAPTASYYDYWVQGKRHRSDGDTIVLDGTDGQHWIYYDTDGSINELVNPSHAQTEDAIENRCLIAMVYWNNNTSEGYLFDERHGMSMSPATHRMLHECVGTQWGYGIAIDGISTDQDGSSNTHAQFGNTAGEVYDEDIGKDINALADPGTYECFWWDGTRWQWDTNAGYPFLVGATPQPQYNNFAAGTLVEGGNNNFVLTHLFATTAEDENPIIVVGQAVYGNIIAAREGAATEIANLLLATLPTPEMKPIATVIIQIRDVYTNSVNARFVSDGSGGDYLDWRANPLSGGGVAAVDHGSLGGLADDDHSGHPWLLGRSGGQTQYGGIDAGDDYNLYSTSHATKGHVNLCDVLYVDEVNDRVGIKTSVIPHGSVGCGVVAVEGANASVEGPHIQLTTASDDYPIVQILAWQHDTIQIGLDSYWDGAFYRSSDAGSNAAIRKSGDKVFFRADDGIAQGNAITWNDQITWDLVNGRLGIGATSPDNALHVYNATANVYVKIETDNVNGTAGFSIVNDAQHWTFTVSGPSGDRFIINDQTGAANPFQLEPGCSSNLLRLDSNDRIGINVAAPAGALDVTSTTGGLIVPRMTQAQRTALGAVNGMIVYDTTNTAFYFYENGAWVTGSGLT